MTGQRVDIGNVPLRRPVAGGRDEAVIEDNGLEPPRRHIAQGNRQQPVDFVALGDVADDMLGIAGAVGELLLKGNLAPFDLPLEQGSNGQVRADFELGLLLLRDSRAGHRREAQQHNDQENGCFPGMSAVFGCDHPSISSFDLPPHTAPSVLLPAETPRSSGPVSLLFSFRPACWLAAVWLYEFWGQFPTSCQVCGELGRAKDGSVSLDAGRRDEAA